MRTKLIHVMILVSSSGACHDSSIYHHAFSHVSSQVLFLHDLYLSASSKSIHSNCDGIHLLNEYKGGSRCSICHIWWLWLHSHGIFFDGARYCTCSSQDGRYQSCSSGTSQASSSWSFTANVPASFHPDHDLFLFLGWNGSSDWVLSYQFQHKSLFRIVGEWCHCFLFERRQLYSQQENKCIDHDSSR